MATPFLHQGTVSWKSAPPGLRIDPKELQVNGYFSSEYDGNGAAHFKRPSPRGSRADRPGMRFGAMEGTTAKWNGMGGDYLPIETGPSVAALATPRPPVDPQPWTSCGKRGTLFSNVAHIPDFREPHPKPAPASYFSAGGKVQLIGLPTAHLGGGITTTPTKPSFHLRCPKVPQAPLPPVEPCLAAGESPRGVPRTARVRTRAFKRRDVFQDRTPFHKGTFSQFPPYLPDPVPPRQFRDEKPAIFTVTAKTKRTMPVAVPWNGGGVQSAAADTKTD